MREKSRPPLRLRSRLLSAALCLSMPGAALPQQSSTPPQETGGVTAPQAETKPGSGGEAAVPPAPARSASLRGRVFRTDRRTPLAAAVVYAVAPDGTVHSSEPSDEKGRYFVDRIPPGTYQLAVVSDGGAYFMDSLVGLSSAHEFSVDLSTVPGRPTSGGIPGVSAEPRGFTYVVQGRRAGGTAFWRSPGGITVIAVATVAAALLMSGGNDGKESQPVSPSSPL